MIKVAILGYGSSSKVFHILLINYNKDLMLTSIISSQHKTIKGLFPNLNIYENINEFIKVQSVDLVIIVTPNTTHYELAKKCLENNLHVVVDKPITTSSIEAQALFTLAKKNKLFLSVFQNRRWDSDFLTVQDILSEQTLGTLNSNFEVILKWSPFCSGKNLRFNVQGSKGDFKIHELDVQEEQLKNNIRLDDTIFRQTPDDNYGVLSCEKNSKVIVSKKGMYSKYYDNVAKAINKKEFSFIKEDEVINVLKIIELSLLSSQENKTIFLD